MKEQGYLKGIYQKQNFIENSDKKFSVYIDLQVGLVSQLWE